jgi:hypothetical protein
MIIYLGRRLPGASSDLPEGRNGPGRSVCILPALRCGEPLRITGSAALPPYLVLLPMGFTEPGRSPGLLVSSYLAVSPLPRPRRKHPSRGGLFSVALSLSGAASVKKQPQTVGVTHHRALWSPDFPPRHVLRHELSERFPALEAHIEAPRRSSRPPRTSLSTLRPSADSDNSTSRPVRPDSEINQSGSKHDIRVRQPFSPTIPK